MLSPLTGFTIGITADRRADEQAELLRRRGADVVHGPAIRTRPLADSPELAVASDELIADPPDTVVALTGIGVRSWFEAADSRGVGDALRASVASATVLARGPKAAGALATVGVQAQWWAAGERSEEVITYLGDDLRGRRIAVQRDGAEQPLTARALAARGADVIDVPVYRWEPPADLTPARSLVSAVLDGVVDAVTFTSAPAVASLFEIAHDDATALARALDGPAVTACVGPVCAAALAERGVSHTVVPHRWRLGPMVRTLTDALTARRRSLHLGHREAIVQGSAVVVDGIEVRLAPKEQQVLSTLLDANGAVVSKRELATTVWGATTDAHLVEVTVGRLRARLGDAGSVIETVPRRGYRLATTTA